MDQPVFWSVLFLIGLTAVAARLRVGRPLLARFAGPLDTGAAGTAAVAVVVLVFHCAAMFFAPWVDVLPGVQGAADAVRAMGTTSQVAYWVPAAGLLVAVRTVWWPALAGLAVTLVGVGATMYLPFPLGVHLAWLAASGLAVGVVATGLVGGRTRPVA